MNLFEFKNFEPMIAEEAMLIPAFKAIQKKYMDDAYDYYTYAFFMYDFRSDFGDIVSEPERHTMVMQNVLPGKTIEKSKELARMVKLYREMQNTPSMRLVMSARTAIFKIESFLNNVDLELTDGNGKPIYNVKMIADVVGGLSKMTSALNDLEATVKRELNEGSRTRGRGEKGFFED